MYLPAVHFWLFKKACMADDVFNLNKGKEKAAPFVRSRLYDSLNKKLTQTNYLTH